MTDTKPTIDEPLYESTDAARWAKEFCQLRGVDIDEGLMIAWFANAIESGRFDGLKRIQSAEMPVEPECVMKMRRLSRGVFSEVEWSTLDYIDVLKAYAQRKDAEAREWRERIDGIVDRAESLEKEKAALLAQLSDAVHLNDEQAQRVYRAEQDKAALIAEVEDLRKLLAEAAEDVEDWGAYASEYFQNKHDLAGNVKKYRDAAIDNAMKGGGE